MKINIIRLAAGIMTSAFLFAFTVPAKADRSTANSPLRHAQAVSESRMKQDIAEAFVEQAYENARLNSPFASFNAEQAAPLSFKSSPLADKMIDYAERFLGTRYRLGASGPKAFDCSGFTSYVFRNFGIELNRSSRMQYKQGTKVNIKDLRPGDLLFFSSRGSGKGRVGHVAIVAEVDAESNTCKFIHASVKKGVTYQTFPDGGYYSRNFIGAKRVIDDSHVEAYS